MRGKKSQVGEAGRESANNVSQYLLITPITPVPAVPALGGVRWVTIPVVALLCNTVTHPAYCSILCSFLLQCLQGVVKNY